VSKSQSGVWWICSACSGRADVVFVIDASDAIRVERFPRVTRLLASVVEQMDIGSERVRVGALKFGSNASIQFHLNTYSSKHDLMTALDRITFVGGRTNLSGALWMMVCAFSKLSHQ